MMQRSRPRLAQASGGTGAIAARASTLLTTCTNLDRPSATTSCSYANNVLIRANSSRCRTPHRQTLAAGRLPRSIQTGCVPSYKQPAAPGFVREKQQGPSYCSLTLNAAMRYSMRLAAMTSVPVAPNRSGRRCTHRPRPRPVSGRLRPSRCHFIRLSLTLF